MRLVTDVKMKIAGKERIKRTYVLKYIANKRLVVDDETFNVSLWWWYLEMTERYFQYCYTLIVFFINTI